MCRSHRTLLFALTVALIASFALPMTASAGSSSDLDCADFSSQEDAQAEFDSGVGDTNRLDANDDGVACEESFGSSGDEFSDDASTDEYPRRGVQTGGGSTATGGTSPLPLILSGGAFTLLMATGGGIALRRRLGR